MPETLSDSSDATTVTCGPIVAGGDALVRRDGQKVLFVEGGIPGENVEVEITQQRKDLSRGRVIRVIDASPSRINPPCPVFTRGCGGCQWQHMDATAQQESKVGIVTDALRRIAKIAEPPVRFAGAVSPFDYRTTMRLPVVDGRVALHRRASKDLIDLDTCLIAHPLLRELIEDGRFEGAEEVTLRVGTADNERVAWVRGGDKVTLPDDVVVTHNGRNAAVHEQILDLRFRVSARSFFQSGPAAASLLASAVDAEIPNGTKVLLDAYAGVGVLGAISATRLDIPLVAIEQDGSSVNDSKLNLAHLDARIVLGEVAAVRPGDLPQPDVIIADPARPGLGPSASRALIGLGAQRIVLVSCDPASLARDVGLLHAGGYGLQSVAVLDLFPQTHHVEAISVFERTDQSG